MSKKRRGARRLSPRLTPVQKVLMGRGLLVGAAKRKVKDDQ